jgi:hypothetical protein
MRQVFLTFCGARGSQSLQRGSVSLKGKDKCLELDGQRSNKIVVHWERPRVYKCAYPGRPATDVLVSVGS